MNASPRLSPLLWLAASLMAGTTISHSAPVPDPKTPQYQGKGEGSLQVNVGAGSLDIDRENGETI